MSISLTCPGCGKAYTVDETFAGRTMKCRQCQAAITVGPVEAAPIPVMPVSRAPAQTRAAWSGGPRLSDGVAHLLSLGLALLAAGGLALANWKTGRTILDQGYPDDYTTSIYGAIVLAIIAAIVLSLTLGGLSVLMAMAIGAAVGREQLSSSPMLRAVGIASLPCAIMALMKINDLSNAAALGAALLSLVVVPLLVKFIGDMKWTSTLVAGPLAAIFIIVAFIASGFLTITLGKQYALIAGLDEKSVRAAVAKDPQKFRDARAARNAAADPQFAPANPGSSGVSSAPPKPVDPVAAKLNSIRGQITAAMGRFDVDTRSSIKSQLDRIAAELQGVKPDTDAAKEQWAVLDKQLAGLFEKLPTALDDQAPAHLFAPATETGKLVANAKQLVSGVELQLWSGIRCGDPASAKIDLRNFVWRDTSHIWKLADGSQVEMKLVERRNPRQTQPWIESRIGARPIAASGSLLLIDNAAGNVQTLKNDGGLVWTVVPRRAGGNAQQTRRTYYTAMDKQWLVIETDEMGRSADAQALAEALAASVKPAPAGATAAPSPFDPARIAPRLADDFAQASNVLRQLGATSLPAIDALLASNQLSATAKQQTIALREEIARSATARSPTGPDPAVAGNAGGNVPGPGRNPAQPAAPIDIETAIQVLGDSNASVFQKRDVLDSLANTPVDPKRQDLIAGLLEEMMLSRDWFGSYDHVAGALKKWWRPKKTVAALLPGLEYDARFKTDIEAVIAVLAETKEKEAVFPIVRWIIEKPDAVVPALKKMGPVAEDEVIKVLRQENPEAKRNAVKILQEIGTRKSMGPLNALAKDQRDRTTAAVAQVAYEAVKERVQNAGTTQPAAPGR